MIAAEIARGACEALWLAMVELAETANDDVITQQRYADASSAERIAARASDLATLATAACVLARYADSAA